MVESMTGFGSAEHEGFKVEIRSLNHRYLEMFLRVPGGLGQHEMPMRERLKKNFSRGKLDVFVTVTGAGELSMNINEDAARKVYESLSKLANDLSIEGGVSMGSLLGWKSMFLSEDVEYEDGAIYDAFDSAADELKAMRLREGEQLKAEVLSIAGRIEELNSEVESLCPAAREASVEKFKTAISVLLEDGADEGRIIQEAASLAEKIDITEELVRVKSHISQLNDMLDKGGTIGRKLDFLMQELIREANTMASKSGDSGIMNCVIEMKSEIERAREQVQNIQ